MTDPSRTNAPARRARVWSLGLLLLALPGCGDSEAAERARREAGEAIDAAQDHARAAWEGLRTRAQPRLRELGDELTRLHHELERHGAEVAADVRAAVRDAEQRLARAGQQLEAARDSTAKGIDEAWNRIDDDLEQSSRSLERAWDELQRR